MKEICTHIYLKIRSCLGVLAVGPLSLFKITILYQISSDSLIWGGGGGGSHFGEFKPKKESTC